MNRNLEAAEATANNDRHPETIKGYKRIIKKMTEFARVQEGWDEAIFDDPPLPDEFVMEFMGMQSQPKDDGSVRTGSTLRKNVSSLKWWYNSQTPPVHMSAELDIFLKRFNKGHKRKIADLKAEGTMDQHEGKIGYSFGAFVFLAKVFLEEFGTSTSYAHLFFVLTWNLIARAIGVASMKYDFIHMDNDMIVVLPPRNKADQAGDRVEGKHIAANPFNPCICPVLALARHVFSDGSRTRYSSVFTRDAYDRFGEVFHNIVRSDRAREFLGVSANKLGKHSGRKAGATYCSSFPGGPGRDAICQRADWSLGAVRDRYIAAVNNGNDQFVARTMSGLDFQSPSFATLPPHFSLIDTAEISAILHSVVNVNAYPELFQGCLPYLLASLAYHHEYLDETLAQQDRLRSSRLWTSGILPNLKKKVILGNGNCKTTGMMATGVPPHIILAVATEKIQETLIHEALEIRGDIANVPGKMCDRLLQQFEVNGALPMTFANVQAMLTTMQEQLVRQLRDSAGVKQLAAPAVTPSATGRAAQWLTWYHPGRGKFFKVPPDFNFPQMLTIKPCWDLYLHGNNLLRIRPYRLLDNNDMRTHADKCRLSNMKAVCKFIIQHTDANVLDANGSDVNVLDSNPEETDIYFAGAWPLAVAKLTNNNNRSEKIRGDLVMTTVYNLIQKYKRGAREA
ncbi:hypothetical protein MHU86_13699 [Fragilaria crotonensis]|nr:hypothetical protein MHU86_13699 [Fragilaria crotonensis]